MLRIRDPLHGTIVLSELEEKLLDSLRMQRLRGVRQLAMAYLVYPGANHTRFEHSIGTLFLADRICEELSLKNEERKLVRAAALLHDIGHTAFSHEAETVLRSRIGSHEGIGKGMIAKGELAEILSDGGITPSELNSVFEKPLGEIITSDIGADRMDYLLRDSHYTGVAYGVVDAERLCSCLSLSKKGMMLQERGLAAAESLLVARFAMFSTVYLHKTVRIASRMLQEAIVLALKDGTLDALEAPEMTDDEMLTLLSRSEEAEDFALRLSERRLYKKAYSIPFERMKMPAEEARKALEEKSSCTVLVDVPRLHAETEILLEDEEGKTVQLAKASELVASLQKMQRSRLDALAICEEKNVKKVAVAAEKLF